MTDQIAHQGSLIYTAAYHGNVKHLKKLLAKTSVGAEARAAGLEALKWRHPHGGATAIYVACEFNHVEAVKLLLEAGAPVDQARDDGATPLYKACQDGNLDIVRVLLKAGAQVDQIDANSMTALWVACHQGNLGLAKVLLESKADPTRKVQEWSPIMLADKNQNTELVSLLKEYTPEGSASEPAVDLAAHHARHLYHAAVHGDEKTVRSMVEKDTVDVNCNPGEGGATPLYATCMVGKAGMVQLLLDANASPNVALANGQTPLIAACETGRSDVVRLLLEHDVELDAATNAGTTALMVACNRGHNHLARMLLDAGAATSEAKKGRGLPLISASSAGNADCVRMLLEEGGDDELDASYQSLTALQWAQKGTGEGHAQCVAFLEEALANSPTVLARQAAADAAWEAERSRKPHAHASKGDKAADPGAKAVRVRGGPDRSNEPPAAKASSAVNDDLEDIDAEEIDTTPPTAPTSTGGRKGKAASGGAPAAAGGAASAAANKGGSKGKGKAAEAASGARADPPVSPGKEPPPVDESEVAAASTPAAPPPRDATADGLRARKPAASGAAGAAGRDFTVKKRDGPAWRPEHTQMAMLVGGAVLFAILIYLFVLTGTAIESPLADTPVESPMGEPAATPAAEAAADGQVPPTGATGE